MFPTVIPLNDLVTFMTVAVRLITSSTAHCFLFFLEDHVIVPNLFPVQLLVLPDLLLLLICVTIASRHLSRSVGGPAKQH